MEQQKQMNKEKDQTPKPNTFNSVEDEELEEDAVIEAAIKEQPDGLDNIVGKGISAPYAVPHYPIELEEQKKKEVVVPEFLKSLEEKAASSSNTSVTGIKDEESSASVNGPNTSGKYILI